MLIPQILDRQGKSALFSPCAPGAHTAAAALIILFAGFLAGCGGSKSANTKVAQVLINPSSASLVAGQVLNLSVTAVNSNNSNVATTFTFNSSNTSVATISPSGLVCGGIWDSTFVVCNGTDSLGNPVSGSATITAVASGVTSGPVTIAVHPSVTSVKVDPLPTGTCLSVGETHQFQAHAFHNGTEITGQVGNFTWSTSDGTVAGLDANGLGTARVPGLTGVVAGIGATTSPAVPFKTCMPAQLSLHLAGDVGTPTTSATLNPTDTKTLLTDMIDEKGTFITPAPITIFSTNPVVATNSGATITAASPGGAGFVAACAPPSCGNGLNTPIYSNVFSASVTGSSPNTTTVYAASSFPPPINTTIPLVPIDISKTPPAVGTAIPLPGTPNSIVFDRTGARAFIGTAVGLAVLDAGANTVSLLAPGIVAKVLAVSPDGNKAVLSNAANDPSTGNPIEPNAANQRVWVFDRSGNTITTFVAAGAVAANFDDDGFKAYIAANNGNMYVFSPSLTFATVNIGGSNTSVANLPSGSFEYVVNSAGLKVLSTCNNATVATTLPTNTTNLQLVQAVKNQDQLVVVDSSGVDIISATVTPLSTPTNITPANCAPNASYSNQFVDFGLGPFTARQLFVASNGSHFAVLPAAHNRVLTVLPGTGPGAGAGTAFLPAGATEALGGGMTPDGAFLWLGIAGTNSVDRINLLNNIDDIQVPMNFQKSDGSPAPPDLVALKPK